MGSVAGSGPDHWPVPVRWYLDREDWWREVTSGSYNSLIEKNFGLRVAV